MDLRQVAECERREDARPQSARPAGRHAPQRIHDRHSSRIDRPAVCSAPRFRINDALPNETRLHWQWQRGGWLLVDRLTGRVSQLNLPEFDPFYSTASWYRDYIAYCGVSDDGKKLYAMVAQVGRRKPVLKKDAGEPAGDDSPDSECPAPLWERSPMRVTFQPDDDQKLIFSLRNRVVDVVNDTEESAD